MTKGKSYIDFEIIWRKIHSYISREDEETFDQWIDEDKKHQQYFKHARQYYQEGSSYNRIPADPAGLDY